MEKKYLKLILGVFIIILLVKSTIASERDIGFVVDDDYNSSTPGWQITAFDKIQDAINAAPSPEGMPIYVMSGIYEEGEILVDKLNIDLIGENPETTIVRGGFYAWYAPSGGYQGKYIKIKNFNIVGGFNHQGYYTGVLASDFTVGYQNVVVENNIIQDCDMALRFDASSNNSVINNTIINFTHSGILLTSEHIRSTLIEDNYFDGKGNDGTAITMIYDTQTTIRGNTIINIKFGIGGGGYAGGHIVESNTIMNTEIGLFSLIEGSYGENLVFNNRFINNRLSHAWGRDGTTFYSNGVGNYWDDFLSNPGWPDYYLVHSSTVIMDLYPLCEDMTPINQCSSTKPSYCDAGELISNCQQCGCPTGRVCHGDGRCVKKTTPIVSSSRDVAGRAYVPTTGGSYYVAPVIGILAIGLIVGLYFFLSKKKH